MKGALARALACTSLTRPPMLMISGPNAFSTSPTSASLARMASSSSWSVPNVWLSPTSTLLVETLRSNDVSVQQHVTLVDSTK